MNNPKPFNFDKMEPIDPTEIEFDLPFHIQLLLAEEPFYARVSRYIHKVPDYNITTAGVRLNPHTFSFEMLYNPKFFLALSTKMRLWVLRHEFNHIFLGHITSRRPLNVSPQKANIAMDEANNSLPSMIEGAPDFCVMPGREPPKGAPPNSIAHIVKKHKPSQAMEYYLNQLDEEQCSGSSSGDGQFDDHSQWYVSSNDADTIHDIASHKLNEIMKKAVEDTEKEGISNSNAAWGSISHEMRSRIKQFLATKLDPEAVLSYFVRGRIKAHKVKRITKINKRYPYIHPGKTYTRRANIAISIDQSGSVSDELLEKFFGWLNKLSKYATFTIIPFDCSVFEEKVYVWEKGQIKQTERVLSGGTCFNAPTLYVNENKKFDGHIIMTDLQAETPIPSRCQRMWITSKQHLQHVGNYFKTNERILVVD